jgi:hypothetical protein
MSHMSPFFDALNEAIAECRIPRVRAPSISTRWFKLDLWGFPMDCEVEINHGYPASRGPGATDPGCDDEAQVLTVNVGEHNIFDALSKEKLRAIEQAALRAV